MKNAPSRTVQLPGIPFRWRTSMSEAELRELYLVLVEDFDFRKFMTAPEEPGVIKPWIQIIPFRDGAVLCIAFHKVIGTVRVRPDSYVPTMYGI